MLDRTTVDETQRQLLRRIAEHDRQALAEFYDQSARLLFSAAVRILGDLAEAEEVTQDVFVQIWNKAATFDGALGVPSHWALGIVSLYMRRHDMAIREAERSISLALGL